METKGCENIREFLSAYIDNELEEELVQKVEQHLTVCPLCRDELAVQREAKDILKSITVSEPAGYVWDNISWRLDIEPEEKVEFKGYIYDFSKIEKRTVAGIAAMVVMAIGISLLSSSYIKERKTGYINELQNTLIPPVTVTEKKISKIFQNDIPEELLAIAREPKIGIYKREKIEMKSPYIKDGFRFPSSMKNTPENQNNISKGQDYDRICS
jgi:hypothetical protein